VIDRNSPAKAAKPPIPPAIWFVLATGAINAIGFGIVIPVTPRLVAELGHTDIAGAAAIGGWLAFAYAVTQFIFSPIVGNLSDRIGRRPVLLISMLGFSLDFIILALAPNLLWVFAVRLVAGVFGASNGAAQSVIADVTPAEDRARMFGLMGAAFGVGFIVGPALGSLLSQFGYRVPFYVAAALIAANFVYGLFALPETLKPENRRAFDWKRANPLGALLQARGLPGVWRLAAILLIWQTATLVYPMVWPYFTMGRYGWSEGLVGISLAMVGLSIVVGQVVILPRAMKRFGGTKAAAIGIALTVINMFGFAAATQSWMVFLLMPLMSMQAFVQPNLNAMMSARADASTQGEVQGFASSVMAIGSLIAPLIFNPLLSYTTGGSAGFIFHGSAMLLAGLLALCCLPLLKGVRTESV
jgi:MFS transporter, DHA1 family, tetracycline resistance protein